MLFINRALDFIPKSQYLDIPTLMMNLKNAGKQVLTYHSECQWLDIGRPDDYEKAVGLFEQSKEQYLKAEK